MVGRRLRLIENLIENTKSRKLTWETGVTSGQYSLILPSGSILITKYESARAAFMRLPSGSVGGLGARVTGGAASYSELQQSNSISTFDPLYVLQVRNNAAEVIEEYTSDNWLHTVQDEWGNPMSPQEKARWANSIPDLYNAILQTYRVDKDKQLDNLLNDLENLQ